MHRRAALQTFLCFLPTNKLCQLKRVPPSVEGRIHAMPNKENRNCHCVEECDLLIPLRCCKGDICSPMTPFSFMKLIQSHHLPQLASHVKKLTFNGTHEFQMKAIGKESACSGSIMENKDLMEKTPFLEDMHTTLSFYALFTGLP